MAQNKHNNQDLVEDKMTYQNITYRIHHRKNQSHMMEGFHDIHRPQSKWHHIGNHKPPHNHYIVQQVLYILAHL